MKSLWVAAALLVTIVGKSAAVSHLRCNGKEYEFPGVQAIRAKCNNERSEACKIECTFKALGLVNPDNSINEVETITTISPFPEEIRGAVGAALSHCKHLAIGLPSIFDDECTVVEPLFKCLAAIVKKSGCEILAPSIFL